MMDGAAEFFRRDPELLPLYQTVEQALLSMEQTDGAVQRTQITFSAAGKVFAAVSLPIRRRKGWPERCLVLTFGLGRPLDHPRIAVRAEPYPGRFTHHVLLTAPEELDGELLNWLEEARAFSASKGRKKGESHADH